MHIVACNGMHNPTKLCVYWLNHKTDSKTSYHIPWWMASDLWMSLWQLQYVLQLYLHLDTEAEENVHDTYNRNTLLRLTMLKMTSPPPTYTQHNHSSSCAHNIQTQTHNAHIPSHIDLHTHTHKCKCV